MDPSRNEVRDRSDEGIDDTLVSVDMRVLVRQLMRYERRRGHLARF
jgi:hypothetical protein